MIILIDAGNTRVKAGWVDPETGERETTVLALKHENLDQLSHWVAHLPRPPHRALGVNVAGDIVGAAIEDTLQLHDCDMKWANGESQTLNVENHYEYPDQLGSDRWLALIGLAQRPHPEANQQDTGTQLPAPLILASFGTATTIDTLCVDQQASTAEKLHYVFQGGLILPGPALMRTSLAEQTAHLPDAQGSITAYPTHTLQAISSGVAAAQGGAVIRQWLVGLDYFGRAPRIFTTGGGWQLVQDELRNRLHSAQSRLNLPQTPIEWLESPALDGLAALALQS